MKILVVSDNVIQYERVKSVFEVQKKKMKIEVDYYHSGNHSPLKNHSDFKDKENSSIDVKNQIKFLVNNYELIISVHCKQLFPKKLVDSVRCINIHPGYNPINRGWYPQVFAIIKDLPVGATIHEMDKDLDHGPIIAREFVEKYDYDTSLDIYNRVLNKEIELFEKNITLIVNNSYNKIQPEHEGVLYLRSDFESLCQLDLDRTLTFREAINHLRALTHGEYKNAYFYNDDDKKIYVSINLELNGSE